MSMIVEQHEINKVIDKMKAVGLTPPTVENKEALVRFHTEGHMKNSCYYFLTEGIRENKSSYLIASFGCFDKGISEYLCTLHEKPEGVDDTFYCSSFDKHKYTIKKQKAIYLDEITSDSIQADLHSRTSENKQADIHTVDIKQTEEPVVNSFVMYDGFYDALQHMPDDKTRLEYLDAICYYGLFRKTKEQSSYIKTMFALIKPQMDINFKRRKDGSNGGRPKKVKAS